MDNIELISKSLSVLTIASQFLLIVGLGYFLAARRDRGSRFRDFIWRRGPLLALVVALVATLGSLYYSEIAGYLPCELCWYQRIFMYPQVILLALAVYKKERAILDYCLALLGVGSLFALYHNYIYLGNSSFAACAAGGSGVSCLAQYVTEFNFVTIPIMSLTAYIVMFSLLAVSRRRAR